jgi:hypothetical protein
MFFYVYTGQPRTGPLPAVEYPVSRVPPGGDTVGGPVVAARDARPT